MRIALSGKAGSGKSTIAKQLEVEYGFLRFSFASKLKKICASTFPSFENLHKEEQRIILQRVGAYFRDIDPYVWINPINEILKIYSRVVVDDLRYYNEAMFLKKHDFKLIRIIRPLNLRKQAGYNVEDIHASECELDDFQNWDLIVWNVEPYPFKKCVEYIVKRFEIK